MIKNHLYFNRPADELIFLTNIEHKSLHQKGKKFSDDHKRKIGLAIKGEKNPMYGKPSIRRKKVSQYTKKGEFIKTYSSLTEAQKETGIAKTHISACCHNKYHSAGGFIWSFSK